MKVLDLTLNETKAKKIIFSMIKSPGNILKSAQRLGLKGISDPGHFIFEINVGKSRIRHTAMLKSND